ncbi:MAG: pseudoazurin [Gammaproteobacteria bacterium]|nr:pseudoazurin [Gammaproteobacteria bacterium]
MKIAAVKKVFLALAFAPVLFAIGKNHVVMMLSNAPMTEDNKGQMSHTNVFSPDLLEVKPGDTVTFVPKEPGHNSVSKKGMMPEGAESWSSPIDKEFTITLDKPGVYGYICMPHYLMGMVGVIIVRENENMPLPNLEDARNVRHPGKAKKAFAKIFEKFDKLEKNKNKTTGAASDITEQVKTNTHELEKVQGEITKLKAQLEQLKKD